MPLGAALVDRARLVRQESTGAKVEGTTRYADHEGEWFKARLTIPASPEANVNPYRKRVTLHPSLLAKTKDLAGGKLEFRSSDRIEVESKQLGTALWEVGSDPQPLRKRRTLIGWELELRRVSET